MLACGEHMSVYQIPSTIHIDDSLQIEPQPFDNGERLRRTCHAPEPYTPPSGPHSCGGRRSAGARLIGWTTDIGYVARQCACNVCNALWARHGACSPACVATFADAEAAFRKPFEEIRYLYDTNKMLDFQEWLLKWPEQKREAIKTSMIHDTPQPERLKAMIKLEVMMRMPKKARLIQFYKNYATQASYGPQFYSLQKAVTQVLHRYDIGRGIDVTFGSGMNSTDIAQWMNDVCHDGARFFYERDGKNWDSTMGPEAAEFRQKLYDLADVDLGKFARACNICFGSAKCTEGLVKYWIEYTVKSGHNDTTLGNGLVNIAIAYTAMSRLGLRGSIIATGDDLLCAIHEDFDLDALIREETKFGIIPEANKFRDATAVSFVSGIFVPSQNGLAFIPLPGRLIGRLWWTTKQPGARAKFDQFRRGIALGLLPTCKDIPVIRVFLRKFEGKGKSTRSDKGFQFHGCEVKTDESVILDYFARRYGFSIGEVQECESYLESLPAEPLYINHPVLRRMSEVDRSDTTDRPCEF
jgi:hypothetical protein